MLQSVYIFRRSSKASTMSMLYSSNMKFKIADVFLLLVVFTAKDALDFWDVPVGPCFDARDYGAIDNPQASFPSNRLSCCIF